jgi:WD40 repeat protein
MRALPSLLGAALALAMHLHSPATYANGRYPSAGQIALSPGEGPESLLVQATYGILRVDGSGEGRWICEQSVGYGGEQDPPIALAGEGELLVAPAEGLRASFDRGCSFESPAGALEGAYTTDLSIDPSEPTRVYATTSPPSGSGPSLLARSDDGGRSFVSLGSIGEGLLTLTIEVAPNDPSRIAVTALEGSAFAPVLLVSHDAGATWLRHALPSVGSPYLSAIDPTDRDRFYLRFDRDGDDALYLSTDAGESVQLVTTSSGPMLGFALSPDGSTLAIGGPAMGVRVADTASLEFVDAARIGVRCLRWGRGALYACGETADGLIVARSFDDGASFEPMLASRDLRELSCPPETPTADLCPGAWGSVASLLGAGGTNTGSSTSVTSGGGAATPDADRGCTLGGRASAVRTVPWLFALTALGLRARRRRTTASPPAG